MTRLVVERRYGKWNVAFGASQGEVQRIRRTRANDKAAVPTRHGKDAVVVVSTVEWEQRVNTPATLYEFLGRSPLKIGKLELDRDPDT